MLIPFQNLSPDARIWIYQADKELTEADKKIIKETLIAFTNQWNVHGAPLPASFDIRHNRFIILAANDTTSGCSIDSSVRVINSLSEKLGINFLDRSVAFKSGDQTILVPLTKLKDGFVEGSLTGESLVFNNLVATVHELNDSWLVPASSTWLKRYILKPESAQ